MVVKGLRHAAISEGILTAVKCYQRRLGLNEKENFVTGDAFVWRYLYKSSVKDIYSCLVKTSETPKCIEKWSKVLDNTH